MDRYRAGSYPLSNAYQTNPYHDYNQDFNRNPNYSEYHHSSIHHDPNYQPHKSSALNSH